MQGIPFYNKDTFFVNATLLSSASQLKYAGGRAAAALLQASVCYELFSSMHGDACCSC